MASCPTPEMLEQLLQGSLPAGATAELTAHLDTCDACQQTLETPATANRPWPRLPPDSAHEPAYEPALQQVMKNLQDAPLSPGSQSDSAVPDTSVLDLLDPTAKPGSLGRLGHYEILEVVGRGGMGVVLKAFDEQLHRIVAVKVMAPQLAASASARQRFAREARAAAAVRDEHVISIHAVEETNELPYLVMEFIGGVSLQQRLDRTGPLEVERIIRIGVQVARGLAAAHAHGLIHRDIKPANILLENGVERVRITDFGLARAVDDASLSQSGVIAGTPQYMAPEQARGEPADHRADLFSLGSVLYAMCVGHPPFRAEGSMAVLKRVCEETPRPIRESNPAIPEWLEQLIERLQAKDPVERCQSASEVAQMLTNGLVGPLSSVASSGASGSPASSPLWRGWMLALAAALLLCGGLGFSEATGVTQVVPTVIRIFHPDGTLVVEVEEPGVKVAIAGDGGEIVIQGAGIHEFVLRPGPHKVRTTQEGQPAREELVTIERGGRRLLKIGREPAAILPVVPAKREPGAVRVPPADPKLVAELAKLNAVLEAKPSDLQARFDRGMLFQKMARLDDAVADFTFVINTAVAPAGSMAYVGRAASRAEQGDLKAALVDYEHFIRIRPSNAMGYGRAAMIYALGPEAVRDPGRALALMDKGVRQPDANVSFQTQRGVCLYRAEQYREAAATLDAAYEAKDRTILNRYFAAMSYHQLGDTERAKACFAEAAKLPQNIRVFGLGDDLPDRVRAEAEAVLKMAALKPPP